MGSEVRQDCIYIGEVLDIKQIQDPLTTVDKIRRKGSKRYPPRKW